MQQRAWLFPLVFVLFLFLPAPLYPQTGTLRDIHAEGMKTFTESQIVSLSGLANGEQVDRKALQDGADTLLHSGLFAKVNYKFDTHNDAVSLTFHVEENPRLPVTYDNFPWFADSELTDAIRENLLFYDGTLPEGGAVVELAGNSLAAFLDAHGVKAQIQHFVLGNPLADGSVQQFQMEGVQERIGSIEFSDPNLAGNLSVQQHLPEIRGKSYSRIAIDLFLAEAIRPIYQQQGFLRAKIGPPEVRLSGNPSQKLPEDIPVFVPCVPGDVYHWKGAEWLGNSAVSTETLKRALGLNPGDVAKGVDIEGGWDRVREAYGRLGYLEVKVEPVATYDDQGHTVSYKVTTSEGQQFHFNAMTITGMSLAGERLIRGAWLIQPGQVLDKDVFEQFLSRLESRRASVFGDLPVHYDTVGHWLQTDPVKSTVDVLLDFK